MAADKPNPISYDWVQVGKDQEFASQGVLGICTDCGLAMEWYVNEKVYLCAGGCSYDQSHTSTLFDTPEAPESVQ